MIRTIILAALLLNGHTWALIAQPISAPPLSPDFREQAGLQIKMRDGILLAADVYLPRQGRRFSTVLIRTPYNRKSPDMRGYRFFASRGLAVVVEDVRGRAASQGTYIGAEQEGPDGNDTINWIAEQPWSNGRVGMAGSSYLGIAQWWAAIQDNPHLVTISPQFSGDDDYMDRFYSVGGALQLEHRLLWLSENLTPPSQRRPTFGNYISHLPLRTADMAASGIVLPIWQAALNHPSYDSYWKRRSIREQIDRVRIPVLSFGGWFDSYVQSDLDAFSRLQKSHMPVETWIGPWGHDPSLKFPTVTFGHASDAHVRLRQLDWFQRYLVQPGQANFTPSGAPLHVFVMGTNEFRDEFEWPLARTRYTPLYLDSAGQANSSGGNGRLRWAPVRKSPTDQFTYDPKQPVPTLGGARCCEPPIMPPGPLDQTAAEVRRDVLVYTSPPLAESLEVTGPVRAVLYFSTSSNDTDLTAKLVDVEPDGRPLLVTDGIQRLRYRLSLNTPVFVKRDSVYQITVDAGVTSYVFKPGHQIRLEVSSSNFPRFDRNLNTTRPNADEVKLTKARQTLYHRSGYPSALILPVIPSAGGEPRGEPRFRPARSEWPKRGERYTGSRQTSWRLSPPR